MGKARDLKKVIKANQGGNMNDFRSGLKAAMLVLMIISGVIYLSGIDALAGESFNLYKGAWFDIKYPSDFRVRPSMRSQSMPGKYNSVFFVSPDKKVEFYVYSPQWSGDANDIELDERTEKASPAEVQKKDGREITYYTITAKDGSYTRAYQQTVSNEGSVKWVIGLKYRSAADYQKYKGAYLKFKGSLQQYAD